MNDERKKRSRAWIWWMAGALLIYALSIFPVAFGFAYCVDAKLISNERAESILRVVYWPIVWCMDHSPAVDRTMHGAGDAIKRALP
ncbi:MAG TPA: hypothetical protein VFG04_04170 [Planctomycetaceae bacterium]|jgi:hypothetical protein|nr:hypothetical protein [Planctomycetaceae bacterium]